MIVLLNYTFECKAVDDIKQRVCTPSNIQALENRLHQLGIADVRELMLKHIIKHPSIYGEQTVRLLDEQKYNEATDLALRHSNVMYNMGHMFEFAYAEMYANIKSEDKFLITLPHITRRPMNVDVLVGWACPEEDYGLDHVDEHEGITQDRSINIMKIHNNWMRRNQLMYDVFFDGCTKQTVIDYLKLL